MNGGSASAGAPGTTNDAPVLTAQVPSGVVQHDADETSAVVTIGRFWATEAITARQESRLREIAHFFTEAVLGNVLVPIITQQHVVSLRALEWLVVNYSKKFDVGYQFLLPQEEQPSLVKLHAVYKVYLQFYRRKNFDAFRRRGRIFFRFKDIVYATTMGQLNFIHWARVYGVVEYAEQHIQEIESDMNSALAASRREKAEMRRNGIKRKRKELSKAPVMPCRVYRISSHKNFDMDNLVPPAGLLGSTGPSASPADSPPAAGAFLQPAAGHIGKTEQ